jgi:glycine dehydrogenase subunit 1
VRPAFDRPFVKEFTVRLAADVPAVLSGLRGAGFLAGLPLGGWFPHLPDAVAVAVTERRTRAEIDALAAALRDQLARHA